MRRLARPVGMRSAANVNTHSRCNRKASHEKNIKKQAKPAQPAKAMRESKKPSEAIAAENRKEVEVVTEVENETEPFWIGLDLGDSESTYCVLDQAAEIVARGKVKTRKVDLKRVLGVYGGSRLAMEVGTHSGWISPVADESRYRGRGGERAESAAHHGQPA